MARKIKIHSVLVAEDVRQEKSGQQTLVGVFAGNIRSPESEIVLPKLIFRIEFESTESFEASCHFALIGPTGRLVFGSPQPLPLQVNKETHAVFALGWGPARLTEAGDYQIKFGVEEKLQKVGTLRVILSQPQPPEAPA